MKKFVPLLIFFGGIMDDSLKNIINREQMDEDSKKVAEYKSRADYIMAYIAKNLGNLTSSELKKYEIEMKDLNDKIVAIDEKYKGLMKNPIIQNNLKNSNAKKSNDFDNAIKELNKVNSQIIEIDKKLKNMNNTPSISNYSSSSSSKKDNSTSNNMGCFWLIVAIIILWILSK